jgi:hypothetical protein
MFPGLRDLRIIKSFLALCWFHSFFTKFQDIAIALVWTVVVMIAFELGERIITAILLSSWFKGHSYTWAYLRPLRKQGILPARGQCTEEDVVRLLESGHRHVAIRLYMQLRDASMLEARRAIDQMAKTSAVGPHTNSNQAASLK